MADINVDNNLAQSGAVSTSHGRRVRSSVREIESLDESLNRAFKLAYFILADRSTSVYVAMTAMSKLKAALNTQGRRLGYTPLGRSSYPAARTRVSLSNLHLLQRLVYIESEVFERLTEVQHKALSQDELIIRYIKHLVKITTRHNSYYVTLGLCRLLYNYTTSETSDVYNLVLQDPERIRDDYYYRSRKKHLMEEIKERFGGLVRTQRTNYGEERFVSQPDSNKYTSLVRECLARFTPWQSACVLPPDLDPNRNVISDLLFEGDNPDEEHEIELNRIHTVIHQECLERLMIALRLSSPNQRLDIPSFFLSNERTQPPEDRLSPSPLTEGELDTIRSYLNKKPRRERNLPTPPLRLVIDGRTCADLNLEPSRSINFDLDQGSELVELRSVNSFEGDEVAVAVCLVSYDGFSITPTEYAVKFDQGRLSLNILPLVNASGEADGGELALAHSTARAASLSHSSLSVLRTRLFGFVENRWHGFRVLHAAIAVAFALCAAGVWFYLRTGMPSQNRSEVAQLEKRPLLEPPRLSSSANDARSQKDSVGPDNDIQRPAPNSPATTHDTKRRRDAAPVRGLKPEPTSLPLTAVKRVYVDPLGDDSFSRELREELTESLRTSNRFEIVQNREEADAVFKGPAIQQLTSRKSVSTKLALVNASGNIVWFLSPKRGKALSNEPTKASATILTLLLHDVAETQRKH